MATRLLVVCMFFFSAVQRASKPNHSLSFAQVSVARRQSWFAAHAPYKLQCEWFGNQSPEQCVDCSGWCFQALVALFCFRSGSPTAANQSIQLHIHEFCFCWVVRIYISCAVLAPSRASGATSELFHRSGVDCEVGAVGGFAAEIRKLIV